MYKRIALCVGLWAVAIALAAMGGCSKPATKWANTGPRVYVIEGAPGEGSGGMARLCDELKRYDINAELYTPDNWLQIVEDIDSNPKEEVILVGHGHGGFLCTQVVRHYAQEHKTKFIDAVITVDPYNKDWPHWLTQLGCCDQHATPSAIPVGHNALKVYNYTQAAEESKCKGAPLVSTRGSNAARKHPYYWYDHFWCGCDPVRGELIAEDVTREGTTHQTIDSDEALLQRILQKCRKAALSPFHYTPPEQHPDVTSQVQTTGAREPAAAGS